MAGTNSKRFTHQPAMHERDRQFINILNEAAAEGVFYDEDKAYIHWCKWWAKEKGESPPPLLEVIDDERHGNKEP